MRIRVPVDEKRFDEWYGLFTDDGHYWVPAVHGQKSPLTENSLAYEDKQKEPYGAAAMSSTAS